ncbi:MAG TPA: hypothetical protein VHO47_00780 [Candidatus Babeliales bacterium]|nr:hypothetical protein [Candidatus Babeliales bacterium]
MVYNFRIAQLITEIDEETMGKKYNLLALPFDEYDKRYNGIMRNFIGGLGSFNYNFSPYSFRTDFAVSYVHEKALNRKTFNDIQTDDILFTFGRNFFPNKKTVITASGLLGVPTHKLLRYLHPSFGYAQFGLGTTLDGSYKFHKQNSLLFGARYIYFVPAKGKDILGNTYTFSLGNVGDILLAYEGKLKKKHALMMGYALVSHFGGFSTPRFDEVVKKENYLRSSWYAVYKYKFLIDDISNRILFYISYGFDHSPKVFGMEYIVTFWFAWSVNF